MSTTTETTKQGWQKLKLNDFVFVDPRESIKKGVTLNHLPMDGISAFTRKIQYTKVKPFSGGSKFRNGDTLFARITPCLENGKTAFVDILNEDEIAFGSTEFIVFRSIKDISDPKFIYYLAISEDFRNIAIKSMSGTSGRQRVSMAIFKDIDFLIPPYLDQNKIAEVLGTYDDLIEVNQKKIKILEELAQSIYKEWFVKPTQNGIPDGWEMKKVENLIKRIPVGKKYENKTASSTGSVPILDQGRSGFIGYHNDEPGVIATTENPVIVFANHTCYENLIMFPFSAIQNVLPFYPSDNNFRNIFWLYFTTKDLVSFNDYKGHWPEFISKKVSMPPVALCEKFGEMVKPMLIQKYELEKQNQNLQKTRDLLIPQLVGGRISIN